MEIRRGDIFYIINNQEFVGSEQAPGRPALVVSNNKCNTFSSVVEIVYLTTKEKKPLPTHVDILRKVPSTALCESVASVSTQRLGEFIREATDEEMKAIDKALLISFSLNAPEAPSEQPDETYTLLQQIDHLSGVLKDQDETIKVLQGKLAEAETSNGSAEKLAAVQTELNIYKGMYEKLLTKLLDK